MIKQIILSASIDSMGDISETEAQQFRNWAKAELQAEYPKAEIEVVSDQQNNVVLAEEDSFEADQAKGEAFDFIDRLWDRCPWTGEHFNLYVSNELREAQSVEAVVDMINKGGIVEGMEGVEFSPEQIAGQYAWDAAVDSGYPVDKHALEAHLEHLSNDGAEFDHYEAMKHAWLLEADANEA